MNIFDWEATPEYLGTGQLPLQDSYEFEYCNLMPVPYVSEQMGMSVIGMEASPVRNAGEFLNTNPGDFTLLKEEVASPAGWVEPVLTERVDTGLPELQFQSVSQPGLKGDDQYPTSTDKWQGFADNVERVKFPPRETLYSNPYAEVRNTTPTVQPSPAPNLTITTPRYQFGRIEAQATPQIPSASYRLNETPVKITAVPAAEQKAAEETPYLTAPGLGSWTPGGARLAKIRKRNQARQW